MIKVFIDTNIIVDLLIDRKPFSMHATELFQKAENGTIKLHASSYSIATTYYILKRYIEDGKLRQILTDLTDYVEIVSIDSSIIKRGLRSKYKDFEDSLQIFAAHSIENIEFIVTRNLKDFKEAGVKVLSADELLLKL